MAEAKKLKQSSASATPGHPPLQLAEASLAASLSHLGQLVPLLGIPPLQLAGAPQLQLLGMPMAATPSQASWSHLWNGPAFSRLRQLAGVPLAIRAIKHFQPSQVSRPSPAAGSLVEC